MSECLLYYIKDGITRLVTDGRMLLLCLRPDEVHSSTWTPFGIAVKRAALESCRVFCPVSECPLEVLV